MQINGLSTKKLNLKNNMSTLTLWYWIGYIVSIITLPIGIKLVNKEVTVGDLLLTILFSTLSWIAVLLTIVSVLIEFFNFTSDWTSKKLF